MSKAAIHSSIFNGGAPPSNFQLDIESPESVSRVIPPIKTIVKIRKHPDKSQIITDLFSFILVIRGN